MLLEPQTPLALGLGVWLPHPRPEDKPGRKEAVWAQPGDRHAPPELSPCVLASSFSVVPSFLTPRKGAALSWRTDLYCSLEFLEP